MNRLILRIALPSIVSNIIVPLLGLIDLAIAGHLGATAFIGAVSVGATMFNLTYWNFGFLRMGTSGMTSQAYGAGNFQEAYRILVRAIVLALTIGIAIILLQYPLKWILLYAISPGEEVHALATSYFDICIWGAPALLGTLAMSGWFLGMQNSFYPMTVSISVNIANIIASLLCVYSFGMGFSGIATGTLIAQWTGFAISFVLLHRMIRKKRIPTSIDKRWMFHNMGKFFRVNGDIFIRSVCLMLVTLFFTAAGARSGDLILAVNALIMQLFMLYSYFMDGFAFAGEALAGRFAGERNVVDLKKCIIRLFLWGSAVMAIFAIMYGTAGNGIMALLTDDSAVLKEAAAYRWWAAVIPVAGMAAFIWDGIYIGLTATRQMLATLLCATIIFFLTYYGLEHLSQQMPANYRLWTAFILYLASRGLIQTLLSHKIIQNRIHIHIF